MAKRLELGARSARRRGAVLRASLLLTGAAACSPTAAPSVAPTDGAAVVDDPTESVQPGLVLPTRFESDRVFLQLRTADGQPLRLFTDTGGGLYLHDHVAERLGLPIEQAEGDGGRVIEVVTLPSLDAATPLPPVAVLEGRLPVAHEAPFGDVFGDGMLGQGWFRDRVWHFDYAAQTLTLLPASVPCADQTVPLGFPEHEGQRVTSYPRVQATIDGRTHDLLFDTGATVLLTEAGQRGLGDGGPSERATSFIVRSVFDSWRAAHPDWRVIEGADRMAGDPMIEVPVVTIGGIEVGPVWFTAREDPNFHQFMSQWMDRRVDGALGGSALRYLEVTIDYPAAQVCLRPSAG